MPTRLLQVITLAMLMATALPAAAKKDFKPLLCLMRTVSQADKAAGCTDYDWDRVQKTCNLQCAATTGPASPAANSSISSISKLGGGTVRRLSGEELRKLQEETAPKR